jgi:hypothetical protein
VDNGFFMPLLVFVGWLFVVLVVRFFWRCGLLFGLRVLLGFVLLGFLCLVCIGLLCLFDKA